MKKSHVILLSGAITIAGLTSIYFIKNREDVSPALSNKSESISLEAKNVEPPGRQAELNGYIKSVEGNEIVLANEIRDKVMTEDEMKAQRSARQKMSQEERQALKQAEIADIKTETINLTIPVGIPIVKGTGTGDGTSIKADLSELKNGVYISAWLEGDQIQIIKIKGIGQ